MRHRILDTGRPPLPNAGPDSNWACIGIKSKFRSFTIKPARQDDKPFLKNSVSLLHWSSRFVYTLAETDTGIAGHPILPRFNIMFTSWIIQRIE